MRLLILAAYPVVRAGLRHLLQNREGLEFVTEADCSARAVSITATERPDVVLVDPDGEGTKLEAVSILTEATVGPILLFTGDTDPQVHSRAIQLGASGVVLKQQPAELLGRAVERVAAGELWIDRAKTATMIANAVRRRRQDPEAIKIGTLTKREREIVALVAEGLRNTAIAERLLISEATVRNHLTSILSKLGLSNRFELAVYAFRHELVEREPSAQTGRWVRNSEGSGPPQSSVIAER